MKLCNFGSFEQFSSCIQFLYGRSEILKMTGQLIRGHSIMPIYRVLLIFLFMHSLLSQIKAIWSVSVPCIVFSALVVFSYYHFGIETLVLARHIRSGSFLSLTNSGFLGEDTSLKYTEKEEEALAVFGIIVILSILEMIVAAAIAIISDTSYQSPQSSPMYDMYSQVSIRRNYSANPIICSCA